MHAVILKNIWKWIFNDNILFIVLPYWTDQPEVHYYNFCPATNEPEPHLISSKETQMQWWLTAKTRSLSLCPDISPGGLLGQQQYNCKTLCGSYLTYQGLVMPYGIRKQSIDCDARFELNSQQLTPIFNFFPHFLASDIKELFKDQTFHFKDLLFLL